jgi:hypothetical protein
MMELSQVARFVALFGVVLLLIAGILAVLDRLNLPLGDLPGDLRIERGNFTCVLPLLSSLIISVVLTVLINLILIILKR